MSSTPGAEPRWRRPTSGDVARLAGVSPTTVSLVLTGKGTRISEATKSKVLAAVAELGYRPNRTAQGLRHGRSATIGLVTDHIGDHPFSGPIVSAAYDVAWEHQNTVLMVNTTFDEERIAAAVESLLDRQVDAIMFAAIGTRAIELPKTAIGVRNALQATGERELRTVLVNAFAPDAGLAAYLPDEHRGSRAMAEHVVGLGHRHIAMLAGTREAFATGVRVHETQGVLRRAGLSLGERLFYGDYTFATGYSLAVRALEDVPRPTALICGNDQMAAGAYLAAARRGLQVPDDLTIVGYDDEPLASMLTPALTTVALPFYELGRRGALALLSGSGRLPAEQQLVPTKLRVRGSSAPVPPLKAR